MRRAGLTEDDDITLNKLAVLTERPFMAKEILNNSIFRKFVDYIGIEPDRYPMFVDRLVERGIFEKNKDGYVWFKHELVQMCIDEHLQKDFTPIYQDYHRSASEFYERLLKNENHA